MADQEQQAIREAVQAAQEAIEDTFDSVELNPGQDVIAQGYVIPAMISAARECISEEDPDETFIAEAGLSSHFAAEQALSDTIFDAASEAADIATDILEAAAASNAVQNAGSLL